MEIIVDNINPNGDRKGATSVACRYSSDQMRLLWKFIMVCLVMLPSSVNSPKEAKFRVFAFFSKNNLQYYTRSE